MSLECIASGTYINKCAAQSTGSCTVQCVTGYSCCNGACQAFACTNGDTCLTGTTGDADCVSGSCPSGTCVGIADGQPCTSGSQCVSTECFSSTIFAGTCAATASGACTTQCVSAQHCCDGTCKAPNAPSHVVDHHAHIQLVVARHPHWSCVDGLMAYRSIESMQPRPRVCDRYYFGL